MNVTLIPFLEEKYRLNLLRITWRVLGGNNKNEVFADAEIYALCMSFKMDFEVFFYQYISVALKYR